MSKKKPRNFKGKKKHKPRYLSPQQREPEPDHKADHQYALSSPSHGPSKTYCPSKPFKTAQKSPPIPDTPRNK